ncbi:MAG TPA: ATP-binding cassette domain-containing protein [Anaerolineales bacterium]|nr:ATP-binding cassette domain-containing protein [Anaerolineales bacterium]
MTGPIIKASSLRKTFRISTGGLFRRNRRTIHAVDGIDFTIQSGELIGYLGPNGAGKSTTIKMLTGLLVPTSGELLVNGRVPWRERIAHVAGIGAVFGQRTTLWWDLPVIESLELLRHVYKVPGARFLDNLAEFTEMLEMGPFLDNPVRTLSLGQRMRADLAAALLHDPAILFLDEPTIGLDVVARERIRRFIQHVNRARGTTVVLTTHDLSDVEKLCERVLIIDRGSLLFDGGLNELKTRFGGRRELVVDLAEPYDDVSVPGAEVIAREELRVSYAFDRNDLSASELIRRVSGRYRIRDLEVKEPDIEATVRRIYEERLLDSKK